MRLTLSLPPGVPPFDVSRFVAAGAPVFGSDNTSKPPIGRLDNVASTTEGVSGDLVLDEALMARVQLILARNPGARVALSASAWRAGDVGAWPELVAVVVEWISTAAAEAIRAEDQVVFHTGADHVPRTGPARVHRH